MKTKVKALLKKERAAYTDWFSHNTLDIKGSQEKFNKWLETCKQLDEFLKENNQSN